MPIPISNQNERVIEALKAGQLAGGDLRGCNSASLMFVGAKGTTIKVCRVGYDPKDPIGALENLEPVSPSHPSARTSNASQPTEYVDILRNKGRYGEAEKIVDKVLADPEYGFKDVAQLQKAHILYDVGKTSEATSELEVLKTKYPDRYKYAQKSQFVFS